MAAVRGLGPCSGLSFRRGRPISFQEPRFLEAKRGGAPPTLEVTVTDSGTTPVVVIGTVDATPYQPNPLPSGGAPSTNALLTADFALGMHLITVSAFNGETTPATCSTTVQVHDTIPPEILSVSATPNELWPPTQQMVPITIKVEAMNNCGPTS